MIFRGHGQPLFASIERRTFRNGPGLQYPVAFKPEIEVQTPRGMLLDDEEQRAAASYRCCGSRLGCGFERALGGVLAERCGFGRARGSQFACFSMGEAEVLGETVGRMGWDAGTSGLRRGGIAQF